MTITRSDVGSLSDTSNLTAYNTTAGSGALPGAANQLITAFVVLTDTVTPAVPTVINNPWGITSWTKQQDLVDATSVSRLCVFTGTTGGSDPGSDTFDIDASGGTGNQTGCNLAVYGWTDSSGQAPTYVQSATGGPTTSGAPSVTLAALGAHSWVVAGWQIGRNPPTGTADTGWTEIDDVGYATPATGFYSLHSNGETSDNTPSATWSSGSWIGIAIEIAVPQVSAAMLDPWGMNGIYGA